MIIKVAKVNMESTRMSMHICVYSTKLSTSVYDIVTTYYSLYRLERFLEMSTADICSGYKNTSLLRIHISQMRNDALPR